MNTQTNLPEGITQEMLNALHYNYSLECDYCLDNIRGGNTWLPDHNPSASHHRKHCTCDGCW